jgi:hypothetical protein
MEGVIAEEADAIAAGSELLRDYWWRRGERERAQQWHERLTQRQSVLQEAKQERERLLPDDTWLAHGLDAATLESLVARLRNIQGLSRAYLVRKRVTHRPEVPLYVLGFSNDSWDHQHDADRAVGGVTPVNSRKILISIRTNGLGARFER